MLNEASASGAGGLSYDYLLSMPLWCLTMERVATLISERDGKQGELEELMRTTPSQMWETDLDAFEAALEVHGGGAQCAPVVVVEAERLLTVELEDLGEALELAARREAAVHDHDEGLVRLEGDGVGLIAGARREALELEGRACLLAGRAGRPGEAHGGARDGRPAPQRGGDAERRGRDMAPSHEPTHRPRLASAPRFVRGPSAASVGSKGRRRP